MEKIKDFLNDKKFQVLYEWLAGLVGFILAFRLSISERTTRIVFSWMKGMFSNFWVSNITGGLAYLVTLVVLSFVTAILIFLFWNIVIWLIIVKKEGRWVDTGGTIDDLIKSKLTLENILFIFTISFSLGIYLL